jgi:hypothetical protein
VGGTEAPGFGLVECGQADGTGLVFAAYGHACGTGGGLWAVMCDGAGGEGI